MESDYDPENDANAAMKLAVAAHGLERQKWSILGFRQSITAEPWRDGRAGSSPELTVA
jgi:hypothetical protein